MRKSEPGAYNPQEIVYFVRRANAKDPSREKIKIGYTARPRQRFSQMRNSLGFAVEAIKCIPGGKEVEGALHDIFQDCNSNGEWFWPKPHLLEFISRIDGVRWEDRKESRFAIQLTDEEDAHLNRIKLALLDIGKGARYWKTFVLDAIEEKAKRDKLPVEPTPKKRAS